MLPTIGTSTLHALGDRRRVDVDVDDLARVLREVRRVADHAVVEARADREQHVAVLHRHVGFVGAVHAEHAEELRVGRRIGAQAHQRVGARESRAACTSSRQLRRSIGQHHAAAGVDHRPLGLEQQLHRLLDLAGVALAHRVVRAHRDASRDSRTRRLAAVTSLGMSTTTGPGRPVVAMWNAFLIVEARSFTSFTRKLCFTHRARDADGVALLERVQADGVRRHLAGEHHHRDRVHVGGGDAGHRVGHAGAGGDQRHADLLRASASSRRRRAPRPARGAPARASPCPA